MCIFNIKSYTNILMFHETLSMVLITFVINDSIFEEVRPAIPSAGFIEVSCTLNILSHQHQ